MKKCFVNLFVLLVFAFGALPVVNAQIITARVLEEGTLVPLSSLEPPYLNVQIIKKDVVYGNLHVGGSDCFGTFSSCIDSSGNLSIFTGWDGPLAPGEYFISISSYLHLMRTFPVTIMATGTVDLGEILLKRHPYGFMFTNSQMTHLGLQVKGVAYKTSDEPGSNLVAKVAYNGPGVTSQYTYFDVTSEKVNLVNKDTDEISVFIPISPEIPDGSSYTITVSIEQAGNRFLKYYETSKFFLKTTVAPPPPPKSTCSTPDPFTALGKGTCHNGDWLPPGMVPPGTVPAIEDPKSSGACETTDPFIALGGGTCHNGGWYPPGMFIKK